MLTIFDCDGVLVDSEVVALEVLGDRLRALGHPMSLADCRDAFMGRQNADIIADVERRVGRALPGEGALMRHRMLERFERELRPVAGAPEALAALKGPRCVASSSDRERIGLTLRWTGLDRFFGDAVFSGTEVPKGKPAPDLFLHVACAMGAAPADCVVVEDSTMGVEAAVAAGMRVIGFTGGCHTDPGHAARLERAGATTILRHMEHLGDALGETFGAGTEVEASTGRP